MMLMMIHCRQVDEVHVWCILDYGDMWCGDMRKDCDQDVSFGVVLFQIALGHQT